MRQLFLSGVACLFVMQAAACTDALTLNDVSLIFFDQPLGSYTIRLAPTLSAIKNKSAGSGKPFYKKAWWGPCPGGLSGAAGQCIEYTVYPNAENFTPDLMPVIKQYNHGKPNRAEVRVLTDPGGSHYIYTTDHEHTFCGPYSLA